MDRVLERRALIGSSAATLGSARKSKRRARRRDHEFADTQMRRQLVAVIDDSGQLIRRHEIGIPHGLGVLLKGYAHAAMDVGLDVARRDVDDTHAVLALRLA